MTLQQFLRYIRSPGVGAGCELCTRANRLHSREMRAKRRGRQLVPHSEPVAPRPVDPGRVELATHQGGNSLAQAIHDFCADAGADCNPTNLPIDSPCDTVSESNSRCPRNLTHAEAQRMIGTLSLAEAAVIAGRRRNLTLSEAARMCR
jgi:hypothetical protein